VREDPAETGAGVLEDAPDPGWKDRIATVGRAARALAATRVEIFREELAQKGSHFGKAAAGLSLAALFGVLGLLLLTALVAAVLAKLLGGPIAGLTAAFVLYMVIGSAAGFFGWKALSRVRPFDFPATRDELRRDLEAVREEGSPRDPLPAAAETPAAEKASKTSGEHGSRISDLEERFRAGSE